MQTRRTQTGQVLFDLREGKGLSPEDVPFAMLRAGIGREYVPNGRTIRRAEDEGTLPIIRYRFGLATFYGVDYQTIWPANAKRKQRKPRATKAMAVAA